LIVQKPPIQRVPFEASQQSVSIVHFSEVCEHPPAGGGWQTFGDFGSFGSFGRQKPLQHSSPVSHVAPSVRHGSSAQAPRSLRVSDWFGK
jgi:hypothetical protein